MAKCIQETNTFNFSQRRAFDMCFVANFHVLGVVAESFIKTRICRIWSSC